MAWAWKILTSESGKRVLRIVIGLALAVTAWFAFMAWKDSVYDSGVAKGKADQMAADEAARKAYFDGAAALAAAIRADAASAAKELVANEASRQKRVEDSLARSLAKWTSSPLVVEKEGKCTFTPGFSDAWNEISVEANE